MTREEYAKQKAQEYIDQSPIIGKSGKPLKLRTWLTYNGYSRDFCDMVGKAYTDITE